MSQKKPSVEPGAPWAPGTFLVAQVPPVGAPYTETTTGWLYRGLGLHLISSVRARYVRKDGTRKVWEAWGLTHLNSGHLVRGFRDVDFAKMIVAVTELAELADWTFVGLDGWQNVEPELPDRMQAWHRRHELAARPAGAGRDDGVARSIGMARLG